jgi:prevent-host-death family protein
MNIMTVGKVKARFSEILDLVQKGEDVVISFVKKKEKVAVLMSYKRYKHKPQRHLGLLAGSASFALKDGFKIGDSELLSS